MKLKSPNWRCKTTYNEIKINVFWEKLFIAFWFYRLNWAGDERWDLHYKKSHMFSLQNPTSNSHSREFGNQLQNKIFKNRSDGRKIIRMTSFCISIIYPVIIVNTCIFFQKLIFKLLVPWFLFLVEFEERTWNMVLQFIPCLEVHFILTILWFQEKRN